LKTSLGCVNGPFPKKTGAYLRLNHGAVKRGGLGRRMSSVWKPSAGSERVRMLERAANKADRTRARQRKYRELRRHECCVPVTVDEPILDLLVRLHRLDDRDAGDRAAVAAAIPDVARGT
jgi:hypothetical protein